MAFDSAGPGQDGYSDHASFVGTQADLTATCRGLCFLGDCAPKKMDLPKRLRMAFGVAVLTACWLPLRAAAQASPTPAGLGESKWSILGRSLEDRVIEYRQFGEGQRQVLVVGPLEGDETAALELVETLAEHLERFPRRASGVRVTLVRDPNPDGRLRRTTGNARGVLLNRNFPTRGWRKLPSGNFWLSGREPESESEVRALMDLLIDVEPACVIVLTATRHTASLSYAGPAETLVHDFAKSSGLSGGLRAGALNLAAEQGSFAVYTGADRKLPTLIVRVPAGMRRDVLWTTYKRGLLAAIGSTADNEATTGENAHTAAQPQTVLATVRRPPLDGTRSHSTAGVPRVSGEDVVSAGELVPVVPLRRAFGPAAALPPSKPAGAQRSAPAPRATIRANSRCAFPPAVLARPSPNDLNPLPLSTMPPQVLAAPHTPRVERLPPIDRSAPPPAGQLLPRPIPLYPETGF